jgi:hypothetical protein
MLNFANTKGSAIRQDIATQNNQVNDCFPNATANSNILPAKAMVIALQQPMIKKIGLDAAVMLSQAFYWQKKMGDRFWYKTQQDWESEIGLTRRQQERSRSILRSQTPCFWHEKYGGTPRKLYFKIDLSVFQNMAILNKQVNAEVTDLPDKNAHASLSTSAKHISKVTNRNNQGDFRKATTGIDAFMSRHLQNEVN